jgi:hypothetical protein
MLLVRTLGPLAGPLAPDAAGSGILLARLASALSGAASVGLLFAIGATLFGRRVGLLGALFLSVSFLHVRDSHYGVNDVPSLALLLLSLYFGVRLLRQPTPRWYVLAGLAGGLATSTKYSMGFFFVPLLVAHWCARRPPDRRPWDRASLLFLALAGGSSLVGYLLGTPYTVLDFRRFRAGFLNQYGLGNEPFYGQSSEPVPLLYLTSLLQGFGVLPLALALIGLALAWRTRRGEAMLLVAFPVAYLAFLLPKAMFFARFSLPLVPVCCILAAYGVSELADRLRPARRSIGVAALLAVALAQPILNDVLHNRLLLQTDTRVQASEWVRANLPPDSRVWAEDYTVTDVRGRGFPSGSAAPRVERFEDTPEADGARYFVERDVQYVVISSFPEHYVPEEYGLRRLHRSLEREAKLVARFAPGLGGGELPFHLESMYTPFWSLEQWERPGPTVSVYSLAPVAARSGSPPSPQPPSAGPG